MHLEYFQSFIISIQKERDRLLSSLTVSSKTNGSQPSIVPLSFLESRLCYLSSSLAGRLSAGFLFHIRPSFTGPSTLQPYDITCGPQSELLFSHTLFLVLFLHPPLFCKKKRSLMAFPERVGGVCVLNMFLCGSTHKQRFLHFEHFASVIKLIAAGPQQ